MSLLHKDVDTTLLITEVIKVNVDRQYTENFLTYLVRLIIDCDKFQSSLVNMLTRMASVGDADEASEHPN